MKPAGRVLGTLTGYGTYYSEVDGEALDLGPPVLRTLRTFVNTDRAFQAWRRHARDEMAGAPAGLLESRSG